MSRLQAGRCRCVRRSVALDEVVPLALDDLGRGGHGSSSTCPDDLPAVLGRPGAARTGRRQPGRQRAPVQPAGPPPVVTGSSLGDRVELRVIDRGPGHPARTDETGSSPRSSGSATPTTPPASAWGSRCPAGSPKRWAAASSRRRPPAAGSPWSSRSPPSPARTPRTLVPGSRERKPRRGGCAVTEVLVVDDEPRPGTRPADQPQGPALRGPHGRHRQPKPSRPRPVIRPTWSFSTWACPTWTACR